MQFTSTLVTVASLATVAVAGAVNLESRQPSTFYLLVCTEPNIAEGSCNILGSTPLNNCISFAGTGLPHLVGTISSFVGTTSAATCTLYEYVAAFVVVNDSIFKLLNMYDSATFRNANCTGASLVAQVGTPTDLPSQYPALDNALSAYRCV